MLLHPRDTVVTFSQSPWGTVYPLHLLGRQRFASDRSTIRDHRPITDSVSPKFCVWVPAKTIER